MITGLTKQFIFHIIIIIIITVIIIIISVVIIIISVIIISVIIIIEIRHFESASVSVVNVRRSLLGFHALRSCWCLQTLCWNVSSPSSG
jgi:hypothetical protein